jgi:hypothetical protein
MCLAKVFGILNIMHEKMAINNEGEHSFKE